MKFSIRDLMWLTVVVALVVGWWVDHRQLYGGKRDAELWREIALKYRDKVFQLEQPSRTSNPLEFTDDTLPNPSTPVLTQHKE